MTRLTTQHSASPRGGEKRHTSHCWHAFGVTGADWRCVCHGHTPKKEKKGARA